jgi:hypothetical protein
VIVRVLDGVAVKVLSMIDREADSWVDADPRAIVGIDCADVRGIEFDDEPRGRVGGMPSWPFSAGKCGAIGGSF